MRSSALYLRVCPRLSVTSTGANTYSGTILWDGRFNEMSSSADLEKWSWGNQVGNYQYYIHGSGAVSKYVNLSPSFKNPGDTGSKQGAKITIDSTAKWNSVNKTEGQTAVKHVLTGDVGHVAY